MKRSLIRLSLFFLMLSIVLIQCGSALASSATDSDTDLLKYLNTPWSGDLDGMRNRRYIRVLVTYSRTNFFLDGAATRGLTTEAFKAFED